MSDDRLEFRRLELRDLNAIEEIERASYRTPWSRSMFAGELAKPSSLSLGAFDTETGELVGYLIISRYVDAWHVMNVAVAPDHRRRKIATMLSGCSSSPPGRVSVATRSKCACRMTSRSGCTSARASNRAAFGAGTTRTTARTH